ncbi:MAG: type VI secretion system ATPase TssH, partial [Paludibacteraceae bacterium]|nr:type VI secretion system ATPase TssH [Paludibacteraceae bacterium]
IRENFEQLNDTNREQLIEQTRMQVFDLLKQTIRPEFLNRIDELIMFTPLNEKEIKEIVHLQLKQVEKMLSVNNIQLEVTDAAINAIALQGYDPQFGARPVKRVIQRAVLNELSKQLIAQTVNTDKPIVVDVVGEKLLFRN